ncbi:MAG TPA: TetR/AcrR family transcriptional regulator [Candidatus Angelobacter sp.]|jgi:AcrR family transcriptional regulator|nr:TetR/AcrR family transcriptional regulator [Candidatus Angelobacter sp.]
MPPHADQHLEERILKTAQRLWKKRGEGGLTLRAVAKAAGTTTPTVYKRFPSKNAILVALTARIRLQLNDELFPARSIEDVFRRFLRFAEDHPHEYTLLFRSWPDVFHQELPGPGRVWFMSLLANRFGGAPENYDRAFYAFFLLCHGASSMLCIPSEEAARDAIRDNFLAVANTLVKHIEILRV